ncbi:PEP/pyruvate-binding domain-containing protein [Sinomonas soli]
MAWVLPLGDEAADLASAGGKGASLARMVRAGLPVPGGFCVTTAAYGAFVAGFRDQIDPRDPVRTAALFAGHGLPAGLAEEILAAYAGLGEDVPVAVRSSATAEDLPGMSFAGQQDSYLNVRGSGLLEAVRKCWASLWNPRAVAYRDQHGVPHESVALAVVVQELVDADASGVLFTADPVTGSEDQTVINAAWGLGESVVGGRVIPDGVVVRRGAVASTTVGDKAVMTVRTADGTEERPVPGERRREPVLAPAEALELAALGARVGDLYGVPVDIEWARSRGRFAIVQARPITVLGPELGEWNDTAKGVYLWTSGNLGEAIPDVMTPITWSFVKLFIHEAMSASAIPGFDLVGNIGGRFYLNLTPIYSMVRSLHVKGWASTVANVFGRIPEGLDVPTVKVLDWATLKRMVPGAVHVRRRARANLAQMRPFLAESRSRCADLRARITATGSPAELAALYRREIGPLFVTAARMLEAAGRQGGGTLLYTREKLRRLMGSTDAEAMLTGVNADGGLASLGPLVGLGRLARGEITRDGFAREYGHRGPHECELSAPRPGEDPGWIDAQLAGLHDLQLGTEALLARQRQAREAAWGRFAARYPRREAAMREQVRRWNGIVRDREDTRSESVRTFWVVREFVLRAGELTGRDDLWYLYLEELLDVLEGRPAALARVPARRAAYQRYTALPPYPRLIVGRFDPVRWAADPHRRTDLYDSRGATVPVEEAVTGFPGAPGVVEGTARVIARPEDGARLNAGEILVTTLTNVGWTPMFPRAAAVVTDLGAPLSHASIVARELGIPAVVGTGNATMLIHDGDRLRVDGERGTVEVLQ